jgi:6-pyruvoyltetrahydropterin/6-carboxytetrahydropterin synthase
VAAEVRGPLDDNHLVIDFLLVRDKLREIVLWLDHYMLLPTQHPEIRVADNDREVTVTYNERRWLFPSGDCRLLAVPNTTSEMLARHIGSQLQAALENAGYRLASLQVEVDECDGQVGVWHNSMG